MPTFEWQGKTRDGAAKSGFISAQNSEAVIAMLKSQAIMPTTVKQKAKDLSEYLPFLKPSVTIKDLVVFTRQFAVMIDAGLPLVQCLDILGNQHENATFKKVLLEAKSTVESGTSFSEALSKHPKVFDRLFVNLVAAGELGGILDTILNRLAVYLEKAEALRRKVKGAMVYPASVSVVAAGVVIVMMLKVIPVFEKMFKDFGGTLPGPTQVVINISHTMQAYAPHAAVMIGILVWLLRLSYRNDKGRHFWDATFLKAPVFGPLIKKVAVARFTRTLSTLLTSGVPILDALELVGKTAGNVVVQREILSTKASIAEGKTIADPLRNSKVFPGMVVQMIAVGEQTGAMDQMLSKIADFYDDEVEVAVGALTAMLEPLMMVVLGGTIGGLLVAMYLPIFKIAEAVK